MTDSLRSRSRILSLVFTDLVGSVQLKTTLGDMAAAELIARHRADVTRLASERGGRIVGWAGDGCFLCFDSSSAAVLFCVALQRHHAEHADLPGVRMGIHAGEVTVIGSPGDPEGALQIEGIAVDIAARIGDLAERGQILMSQIVFDGVRSRLRDDDFNANVQWVAHGDYELKGLSGITPIAEIGVQGIAPLRPPKDSSKAHRAVLPSEEEVLGWRPGVGQNIPGRANWRLAEKLGDGGFGEVWLAENDRTREKRVFKFCFEGERLRGLKREILLFRVLRESLGERDDIARILDWQFDAAPYFLESEYTGAGNLKDWADAKGGLASIPVDVRLELIARIATALGAAHSVGVLHKDIKPSNILVEERPGSQFPNVRLTDFGIGLLTDQNALKDKGFTMTGLTETFLRDGEQSATLGTRLYMAPELFEGALSSVQSDIYSLGVMLYQTFVGDFSRPIAPGWERDVTDDLLKQDLFACIDGHPEKRLKSAAILAERLRSLPARREEKLAAQKAAEQAATARKRIRRLTWVCGVTTFLILAAVFLAYQERSRASRELTLREQAEQAQQRTAVALGQVEESKKAMEEALYYSQIALAETYIRDGKTESARVALRDAPASLRAWEWGHLVRVAFADELKSTSLFEPHWDGALTNAENWENGTPIATLTLSAHKASVESLEITAAGSLISGGNDGRAVLWDTNDGHPIQTFSGGNEVEWSARITPDMRLAVTTRAWDRSIRLWAVASGEIVRTYPTTHDEPIEVVRFSRDGKRFYSGSADGTVRIWSVESGGLVRVLQGHSGGVTDLRQLDDRHLMTASTDGTIRIWNDETGEVERSIAGPAATDIVRVELSRTGRRAATNTSDGQSLIWDTSGGTLLCTITGRAGTRDFGDFSPDETAIAFPAAASGADVWSIRDGKLICHLGDDDSRTVSVCFNPSGSTIYAGSRSGTIKAWSTGRHADPNVLRDHTDIVYNISFSQDGNRMLSAGYDGKAVVWDRKSRRVASRLQWPGEEIRQASFSPKDERIFALSWHSETRIWDGTTYQPIDLPYPTSRIEQVKMGGPRSEFNLVISGLTNPPLTRSGLVLCLEQDRIVVRDFHSGALVARFDQDKAPTGVFNFSHDENRVVTSSFNGEIWVWELKSGSPIAHLQGHRGMVSYVSFSPDDKHILSSSLDHTARIWDISTGEADHVLSGHTALIVMAQFDPAGKLVATCSSDNTVGLWDAATGERLHVLEGLSSSVNLVQFNSKGDRLLGMAIDGLSVWDTKGRHLLDLPVPGPASEKLPLLAYATWTPDGDSIVASYRDGTIRFFDSINWKKLESLDPSGKASLDELLRSLPSPDASSERSSDD